MFPPTEDMKTPISMRHRFAQWARPGHTRGGLLSSIPLWCVFVMLAGAVLAWDGRYAMDPDGLSYLDMASSTAAQGWHHLINGYWSPLYAAILAIVYWFHPSPRQEIPAVQFVNWIIFDIATMCFAFFLRRWLSASLDSASASPAPLFVPFAFCTFLMGTLQF